MSRTPVITLWRFDRRNPLRPFQSHHRKSNPHHHQDKAGLSTVAQLEKEFIRRYGLDGTFSDLVDYLDLNTGEVRTFPKYANYKVIFDAFKVRQKNGFYQAGHIVKLADYLGLDEEK